MLAALRKKLWKGLCQRLQSMSTMDEQKETKFCADISQALYRSTCKACSDYGFELVDETNDDCFLIWKRTLKVDDVKALKPHQKISRFLNIEVLSHKQLLNKVVQNVQHFWPHELNLIPKSWSIPDEWNNFVQA